MIDRELEQLKHDITTVKCSVTSKMGIDKLTQTIVACHNSIHL